MRALVLAALVALAGLASGQQKPPAVRPEVGKPLQAASEALKAKRAKDALARVREAQAVPRKTPYEDYLVTRMLGQAAAAAGDNATAAPALETAANASATPQNERLALLAGAASAYYAIQNYTKAAALAARYFEHGGSDRAVRTLYAQSLYLSGNYAGAARELAADVQTDERAGREPSEQTLQLLANAYLRNKDSAAYGRTMEKLVASYPKRDYWTIALHEVATRPGFNERLAIDVARLRLEVGAMREANDYLEYAQLALLEGFPLEASRAIDKGYAAGVLGRGPDAARHKRLKDLATKSVAERSAGKDDFQQGFNLVLHGSAEQGLGMMQQAMKTGGEHARLRLAYAYHLAGQNEKAVQIFKSVQGADGAAALARLWVIRLNRAS